jgi:hypothetical protein
MTAGITKQLEGAAIAATPAESSGDKAANNNQTVAFLAKLAEMRERYLQDLITAREKARKNFL